MESDCEDHGSDSEDYSGERGDRFDDESPFNLGFLSKERSSSVRIRSFRSYDSLNLMEPLGASGSFQPEGHPDAGREADDDDEPVEPADQDREEEEEEEEEEGDSGAGSDPLADRSSPEEEASQKLDGFSGEERFDSGISNDPLADRSSPEGEEEEEEEAEAEAEAEEEEGKEEEEEEGLGSGKDPAGRTGILRRSAEALSEDSGYGDASGGFATVLHNRTLIHFKVDPLPSIHP